MTALNLTAESILPRDSSAKLVGRVWSKKQGGPCVVYCENGTVRDLTPLAPTVSKLLEAIPPTEVMSDQPVLGQLDDFLGVDSEAGSLLAPCDLQAVKAAGVTFADSMVERVIEERAKGDPAAAQGVRNELRPLIGDNLKGLVPGSEQARAIKQVLQERGYWSQYLEVGIGEFAEIFTKAQPMSSVGCGARIGISTYSNWNNPEPEIVLAVNSRGDIVGATLGNDVNLRDIEGRSALLLGKAKDNNAACALGPFIRLFDKTFTLADVESAQLSLTVAGRDGFVMQGTSDMSRISRKPADLAAQTMDQNHQYPDGFVLFLGTLFAPVEDRGEPGKGFTHDVGDIVKIASDGLGVLVNEVGRCNELPHWTFGTRALMENLAGRRLL